jgi:hypothetical protein
LEPKIPRCKTWSSICQTRNNINVKTWESKSNQQSANSLVLRSLYSKQNMKINKSNKRRQGPGAPSHLQHQKLALPKKL